MALWSSVTCAFWSGAKLMYGTTSSGFGTMYVLVGSYQAVKVPSSILRFFSADSSRMSSASLTTSLT